MNIVVHTYTFISGRVVVCSSGRKEEMALTFIKTFALGHWHTFQFRNRKRNNMPEYNDLVFEWRL